MAVVRVASMEEAIPGYRLIERLGQGGCGEVWKAEAPGGVLKAVKLVFGTLESAVGGADLVQQELQSLDLVKRVRHPYILALDRYDIIAGQLLVVTELADRNLFDRYQQCLTHKQPGVPRAELLRYMGEVAEALDLMNFQFKLQHCDIKPQNLLLVHGHIKVADFGLVRPVKDGKAAFNGVVTPLYAAPEMFEGWASSSTDQYSLAILYQELLTGRHPFSGSNARQLLMQHLTQPPVLSPLPPADRGTVARALAKKPAERFASCTEFVRALRGQPSAAASGPPRALARPTPPSANGSAPKPAPAVPSAAAPPAKAAAARPAPAPPKMAPPPPPPPPAPPPPAQVAVAIECPHCRYQGVVPGHFLRLRVRCPECKKEFPVADAVDSIYVPPVAPVLGPAALSAK